MRNALLALSLMAGCSGGVEPAPAPESLEAADLIVHHAKVVTVDGRFSIAEAVAIRNGRIIEVGSDAEALRYHGPKTRLIDAEGNVVLPGLYDSHVHLVDASTSELAGPLPELRSLEDAFNHIRARASATPEGQWIVLRYAFPTRLKDARFPTRAELDAAAPKHPVLYHAGPAGIVNSKALEISGITRDTPHPPAGQIVKDPKTGEPTGMLRNAYGALKGLPPPPASGSPDVQRAAVKKLLALYNAQGITSVADRDGERDIVDYCLTLRKAGELTCRVNIARSFDPSGTRPEIAKRLDALPGPDGRGGPTGAGDEWVRIGPIKLYMDGGMLNGSAWMREPWPPGPTYQVVEPDYHGLRFLEPAQLEAVLEEAARRGWQMTAHTAGEKAMDDLLDAYEAVNRKVPIQAMRWCITHANFPSQRNLEICRRLGVCADVQPAWLYKDGATLLNVLGERRIRWFQPYKTWLQYTTIGGGSDHMIRLDSLRATNPWNPWLAMWVTLTRKTEGGAVPNPEERLTREEAIRLYTINNAFLHKEENEKGSIEIGKLGDLIIVDRDVLACPVDEVRGTRVLATIVGGRVVHPAGN